MFGLTIRHLAIFVLLTSAVRTTRKNYQLEPESQADLTLSGLSQGGASPGARAKLILENEPKANLTSEMKASFSKGINVRPKLADCTTCTAAHGTSLAAMVSMLQNSNGQITTGARRKELTVRTTTGEARTNDPGRGESYEWVLGMDMRKPRPYLMPKAARDELGDWGLYQEKHYRAFKWHPVSDCLHFALGSTGWTAFDKVQEMVINSEAAKIPVVLVGDMVQDPMDPMSGANYQSTKVANLEDWIPQERVPAMKEIYMTEVYGKALNIRGVYVFAGSGNHPDEAPTNPDFEAAEDEAYEVVKEVVRQISSAYGGIFDDIYVGRWSKEIFSFMKAFPAEKMKLPTPAEFEALLFPTAPVKKVADTARQEAPEASK